MEDRTAVDREKVEEGNELLPLAQACEACGVEASELERWITSGLLVARHAVNDQGPIFRVFDLVSVSYRLGMGLPPHLSQYARRVLIAEDDKTMARAIERVLRNAAYSVKIAADGFQASSLVEPYCPAIIILDLNMPYMRGLEVLTHIRSNAAYAHIKILVVSAATPESLAEATAAGADWVLEKPFENAKLLAVVRDLVQAG